MTEPADAIGSADGARVVTSDVGLFWSAFDVAVQHDVADRAHVFQEHYFDRGSPGLRDYAALKIAGETESAADALAAAIDTWPRFYEGVRGATQTLADSGTFERSVQRGVAALPRLLPGATCPDVYLVIGRLASAGTQSDAGVLIGAEVFAADSATPRSELPGWAHGLIDQFTPARLVHVIVHEIVHTLQPPEGECCHTLLDRAVREGTANLLAELALGQPLPATPASDYAQTHAATAWDEFRREMDGPGFETWIGSWGRHANHGAPDLGYWIGHEIVKGYYARADDKPRAVQRLVRECDGRAIFRESGCEAR